MNPSQFFAKLQMVDVCQHYANRLIVHLELRKLFEAKAIEPFANLALGIANTAGNYSAAEHRRGPSILNENGADAVFGLAKAINDLKTPHQLPDLIYRQDLHYIKIGVGSEIAMMLRPNDFWVGNRRTIWCHLLVKHKWSTAKANRELKLYYKKEEDDTASEMAYTFWRDIYLALEPNLLEIGDFASIEAKKQGQAWEPSRFLWPDAVATFLYDSLAVKSKKVPKA